MRTTLDIDDDVLAAAKELSRLQQVSAGRVISQLLRQALAGRTEAAKPKAADTPAGVGGFRPFASRGVVVSNDKVNELRDAEGI